MTSEPVADGAPRGRRVPAWTIGRRLAAGYALILVLMAGVGAEKVSLTLLPVPFVPVSLGGKHRVS